MAQICEQHNLALAADGKCVLCRRAERPAVLVSRRVETAGDRVITVALLLCMLVATGSLIWLLQQPAPEAGRGGGAELVTAAAAPEPEPIPAAVPDDGGTTDAGVAAPDKPPSAAEVEAVKNAQVRRERRARIEAARAKVEVTMYSTQWCSICDAARFYLDAARVDFTEERIDVDEGAEDRLAKINKARTVPTFTVGGEVLVGYNAYEIEAKIEAAARAAAGVDAPRPESVTEGPAEAKKKTGKKAKKAPAAARSAR